MSGNSVGGDAGSGVSEMERLGTAVGRPHGRCPTAEDGCDDGCYDASAIVDADAGCVGWRRGSRESSGGGAASGGNQVASGAQLGAPSGAGLSSIPGRTPTEGQEGSQDGSQVEGLIALEVSLFPVLGVVRISVGVLYSALLRSSCPASCRPSSRRTGITSCHSVPTSYVLLTSSSCKTSSSDRNVPLIATETVRNC